MAEIVSAVFGSSDDKPSSTPTSSENHTVLEPKNLKDASWMLKRVLAGG
jgi:hypothetical protein